MVKEQIRQQIFSGDYPEERKKRLLYILDNYRYDAEKDRLEKVTADEH